MSTELPSKSMALRSAARVAIVAATYNEKYTSALLENCLTELRESDDRVTVDVVRVPGAFEVPMMVKHAIVKADVAKRPDVVIALGVILKGSTAHADLVGTAVTNQLLAISCEEMTPVIHEVLLLDNEQQAFARCIASSLNRGREAARAAMNMLHLLEDAGELQSMMRRASSVSRTASIIMH
ncbi:MAG: 6,7-dimethyl-8-ribityllumazine synthase [Akkermansia sp.]|nr:6,7-dimethyl-8-ribityllumazine synthase [Akkermansia sp.]